MKSIYVIGDIHGEYQKLLDLINKIETHKNENYIKDAELVFVGDYIDRGLESASVLNFVYNLIEDHDMFTKVVALMGNHEEWMINCLYSNWKLDEWILHGGDTTITSFDTTIGFDKTKILNWISTLPLYYEIGDVCITHAGLLNPNKNAEQCSSEELLWCRGKRYKPHNKYQLTIHGHTPHSSPFINKGECYIDTGAVFGGPLTSVFIEDVDNVHKCKIDFISTL